MYTEDPNFAAKYRRRVIDEANAYIASMRLDANKRRDEYFAPDMTSPEAYAKSIGKYRTDLINMLGRPLTEYPSELPTNVERVLLDEDELGTTERLWIEVLPGVWSYGLLFVPRGEGKFPYINAYHGGGGTCEIVSSVYRSANYNDLVQRTRKKINAIIYAPQLILWETYSEEIDGEKVTLPGRYALDASFKQVGGSNAAYELFKIRRATDWIVANLPVDTEKMGVLGLSYGGFYTQMTAASDTRFKAALSSGYFNDRFIHPWVDWTWFDSGSRMLDSEIVRLICPRYLCIEVGEVDPLFKVDDARRVAETVTETYNALGIGDKFKFNPHPGNHEFNKSDENLDWFIEKLLS